MSLLDIFALFVLAMLLVTVIAVLGVLGALPGRIARQRKHPQADAIAVGGWIGLLFFGVLWPLVLIWAYTRPIRELPESSSTSAQDSEGAV